MLSGISRGQLHGIDLVACVVQDLVNCAISVLVEFLLDRVMLRRIVIDDHSLLVQELNDLITGSKTVIFQLLKSEAETGISLAKLVALLHPTNRHMHRLW